MPKLLRFALGERDQLSNHVERHQLSKHAYRWAVEVPGAVPRQSARLLSTATYSGGDAVDPGGQAGDGALNGALGVPGGLSSDPPVTMEEPGGLLFLSPERAPLP